MATKVIFGVTCTINAGTTLTSSASGPRAAQFDAAGNLWMANYTDGTIRVLPVANGTLFGVSVTANTVTTITTVTSAGPWGIAFDAAGNLYISNFGHSTLQVLPVANGTIFGTSVTANTVATLFTGAPFSSPANLTFDAAGNLWCANSGGANILCISPSGGTLFGTSFVANTPKALTAGGSLAAPRGIAFDAAGNLWFTDNSNDSLYVVPLASGTLFGVAVTANTRSVVFNASSGPGISGPRGFRFDVAQNVWFVQANTNDLSVMPQASGTLFAVSVTANVPANVVTTGLSGPSDVEINAAGDMFIVDFTTSNIVVLAAAVAVASAHNLALLGVGS